MGRINKIALILCFALEKKIKIRLSNEICSKMKFYFIAYHKIINQSLNYEFCMHIKDLFRTCIFRLNLHVSGDYSKNVLRQYDSFEIVPIVTFDIRTYIITLLFRQKFLYSEIPLTVNGFLVISRNEYGICDLLCIYKKILSNRKKVYTIRYKKITMILL